MKSFPVAIALAAIITPALAVADEVEEAAGTADAAEPADTADTAEAPADTAVAPTDAVATPAPKPPAPGLTLPKGKINVAVNLEVNMTADKVGKPISISPDVSYGVTPDLTVALVHSSFALTGFRAKAGAGICVTGTENGCSKVYDNVGAEAWYSVARGPTAVAVGGGVHAIRLDGGFYDLKVGAKLRHAMGKIGVNVMPSLLIAMTERGEVNGVRVSPDSLWVPVLATYKATKEVTVGLGTGLKLVDLSAAGDSWEVSLGAVGTYAIDPTTTVGASWIFGKVLAGIDNPPDPAPAVKGLDFRGLQVWGAKTF